MKRAKKNPWVNKYLIVVPLCIKCGKDTDNKSRICTPCRNTCSLCEGSKSYNAKICISCRNQKKKRKKGKRREKTSRRSIPTLVTLQDGTVIQTRSLLEASWILVLQYCPLVCYECQPVPCIQIGKFGPFKGSYLPDLLLQDTDGNEFLCELKPTAAMANSDTRPERALSLNSSLRFVIIGGEPDEPGGFFVKLLSSEGVTMYENVQLEQFMLLFGCE